MYQTETSFLLRREPRPCIKLEEYDITVLHGVISSLLSVLASTLQHKPHHNNGGEQQGVAMQLSDKTRKQ